MDRIGRLMWYGFRTFFPPITVTVTHGHFSKWIEVAEDVRRRQSRGSLQRVLNYMEDSEAMAAYLQELAWSIQSFTVSTLYSFSFRDLHLARLD